MTAVLLVSWFHSERIRLKQQRSERDQGQEAKHDQWGADEQYELCLCYERLVAADNNREPPDMDGSLLYLVLVVRIRSSHR